ncbi:MAG: hydrogenase maturation nickel metallochaperone HypA [Chthoniobacter sp.]|nr:hydrogenase maturation nickel metallochaperone HypA [Chthoniobacter sp.]
MHEHSMMNDLMAKIKAVVNDNNATRAVSVEVWLGALSHMSPDHFTEHYEESAKGTVAEGAKLKITLSDDINDPNAQQILLSNIELED